jgi:hypothetical protein
LSYPKETNPSLFLSKNELPKSIEIIKTNNKIKNNINGVIFIPNLNIFYHAKNILKN